MLGRSFPLGRGARLPVGHPTLIMGILNVTPDSFSDGGRTLDADAAVAHARRMVGEGAQLIDVGGESTRPGAEPVSLDEELRRVVPVVRAIAEQLGVPVAVDTTKAAVFTEAYRAGASLLNDVSGLAADPDMASAAAQTDAAVVLMHRRGDPNTMDSHAHYPEVVRAVIDELGDACRRATSAGIAADRLILDPGLGFAKQSEHNWTLLRELARMRDELALPFMVGPSRKRFLGALTGRDDPRERDVATAALCAWLAGQGVECVRVHAVAPARDALLVAESLAGPVGTSSGSATG